MKHVGSLKSTEPLPLSATGLPRAPGGTMLCAARNFSHHLHIIFEMHSTKILMHSPGASGAPHLGGGGDARGRIGPAF
eukprot:1156446-Pelagomonas_calceolata.AAC.9